MINLKNGYGIVSDGKCYTLVQDAIKKRKDGSETKIKKQISYHLTIESALQSYSKCVMADLVANEDLDLVEVKKALSELKEELRAYE